MRSTKSARKWTDSQLQAAMKEIQEGKSWIRAAAAKFGIPSSSLHDHLSGKTAQMRRGPQTVLSQVMEKEIATTCIVLQEFGFPVTKDLVASIIRDLLQESGAVNPFTDSVPGCDWWDRFLKRWPVLSQRKPQHLPRNRALGATPAVRCYLCIIIMSELVISMY